MRARTEARARVISPSRTIPVSAMESALRPARAAKTPDSSQPSSSEYGYASVPNMTFSGTSSSHSRSVAANVEGREQQRLRGEIEISIRLGEQSADLAGERPASMDHHEVRLAQRRVVRAPARDSADSRRPHRSIRRRRPWYAGARPCRAVRIRRRCSGRGNPAAAYIRLPRARLLRVDAFGDGAIHLVEGQRCADTPPRTSPRLRRLVCGAPASA